MFLKAGGFGGICIVIVGHPLDTIKVRMQLSPDKYEGAFHAIRTMVTQEGPLSLYKGMSAPLISVVPIFSVSFMSFGLGKKLMTISDQKKLSEVQLFLSGMFSGACISFITSPTERIKCLLQSQAEVPKKYHGFLDCATKLWKEGGIRNLYVGICATMLRDVPASGTYFYSYERIMIFFMDHINVAPWQPLAAGGFAGILSWLVGMPGDSIKTQLQSAPLDTYPNGVRSIFPTMMKRKGGIVFLYQGIMPVLIRAFAANVVCFLGIEMTLNILKKYIKCI